MNNETTLEYPGHSAPFADSPAGRFGSRGVRRPRRRNRNELDAFARNGAIEAVAELAHFDTLVRDADAMHPEILNALDDRMARLQHQWESLDPDDRVCTADWIDLICRPWLEARVPLRGNGLEPAWAHDFLFSLLQDFDTSGQLIESTDAAEEKPQRSATSIATTARLAVAAGWLAWSHLIVDPAVSGATLTLLSELLDRLDNLSCTHATGFTPADRGWTLAGLALEERLLRHWNPDLGRAH
jgi:hypothetical protein